MTQVIRLEPERTRRALIRHLAVGVDQIHAVRPPRVGLFGGVAELIEHGREFNAQFSHTRPCDKSTLVFCFRTGKNNLIFNVALHLPHVAGMRLGDVDHQKRDAVAILLVEFIEGGNLPPEWRSGIAAEHQHDRLRGIYFGEMDGAALVELGQQKIGGGISNHKGSGAGVHPECFNQNVSKGKIRKTAGCGSRAITRAKSSGDRCMVRHMNMPKTAYTISTPASPRLMIFLARGETSFLKSILWQCLAQDYTAIGGSTSHL